MPAETAFVCGLLTARRHHAVKGRLAALVLCTTGIAGCGTTPASQPAPLARAAQVPVSVQGEAYLVDIAPGPDGTALSGGQVVRVAGMTLRVLPDGALTNSDGRLAKAVAEQGCTANGMRFNPLAQGRYVGGAWSFPGACT